MDIRWSWKLLSELSGAEVHEIMEQRQKVFVVEQNCAYLDADSLDRHAWHLLGRNSTGELVAYARVIFPGKYFQEPSFGRVLTVESCRMSGLGKEIVRRCIKKSKLEFPDEPIRISAQTYLANFYSGFGFRICSEAYDDEGIEHIDMILD